MFVSRIRGLGVGGAALLAAACSKEQPAEAPATIPSVMVTATDYAFQMPDTLTAGVTTFRLVNQGKELHHLMLVRLAEGMTAADFQNLKPEAPPPPGLVMAGGPNPAPPGGGAAEGTLDLKPGHYVAVCVIPAQDGVLHMMKGMTHEFQVVAGQSAAEAPTPDVTIKLSDYAFEPSQPLTAGHHVIRIENSGPQPHEMVFVKLDEGKTMEDAAKWAETLNGPPPFTPVNGAAPLSSGESMTVSVDLSPGTYVLICFVADSKDGKPHAAHGMAQQISVQ